jgi:hypothetical protein
MRFSRSCAFLMFVCGLSAGTAFAQAEPSNIELVAMMGGRIIGAAKACNVNADRVRRTSERLVSVVSAKSATPAERKSALGYLESAKGAGMEQVRSERSTCSEIHVDFSEMEIKLGRAPGMDSDRVVAKRGVPPMGAIRPDGSATRRE